MKALLPALLALVFAAFCGNLAGAATAWGALTSHLLLLLAAVAAPRWSDPLGLGGLSRWLPWALAGWSLASCLSSPVTRAGWVGLVLLPCLLLLPGAVSAWWREPEPFRAGLRALAAVVAGIAAVALAMALVGGGRAAAPLGHHGLLAAWLLALAPLAVVARLPSGGGLAGRLWAALPLTLAGLALLATRSLAGLLGLLVELLLLAVWSRRYRRLALVAGVGTVVVLVTGGRLLRLGRGEDPSAWARQTYLEAGLRGVDERPWLGWGPGSVPRTIGLHLEPRPGVNPPGEIVGQMHSLPADLQYELGGGGLLLVLALVAAFAIARRVRRPEEPERWTVQRAGLAGLLGCGTAALFNDPMRLPAVAVAASLAAGACLAAERLPEAAGARLWRWPAWLAAALALAWLAPLDLAHWSYQRARAERGARERRSHLERAGRLDRRFPLYQARLAAVLTPGLPTCRRWLEAAAGAPGVGPIWAAAGRAAAACGLPEARPTLQRALALDPLGGFAPFELALLDPSAPEAPACLARALLAEPRLGAARRLGGQRPLVDSARREVLAWEGIDPGWREALAAALGDASSAEGGDWALSLGEADGREEVSLFAFQRASWPDAWALETVGPEAVERLGLPPASELASSLAAAFPRDRCSPREAAAFDSAVTALSR